MSSTDFFYPLCNGLGILFAGRREVRRGCVHQHFAIFILVGGDVNVHNTPPHVRFICVLLAEQRGAVFFAIHFDDAAVCLLREDQLCNPGYNAGVKHAAEDCEN